MHKSGIVPPLRLCFFMWLAFSIEHYLNMDLGYLGIYPRDLTGLIGILFAPMLHGNFNHLASNTIPLLVLGGSLFFFYPAIASRVFLHAYFFTNILVWVFARPFYHIGASGLVYALASFLVFYGLFKRNFKSVFISAIIIFLYGGMAYGLLSLDDRVSWESHLMGAVVGLASAFTFSKVNTRHYSS
ncbi:rhomboid family intramembrane serine protease [Ekhidna sp.]|uniref:rhomboid family intramembrane serine protease n=1 Tax=Ekhidna sp. TaxID=2608089 RepID=UPI003B50CD68